MVCSRDDADGNYGGTGGGGAKAEYLLKDRGRSLRTPYQLYVVLAHTLLTLVLTYPLIFRLTTHVIGPPEDNLQSLWNLWWVKQALLELHTHPYHTDYLFYPQGASLAFHTLSLFNSVLSIPLQLIFNRITCYNLLILLSFVLAGWGMYLLAYQLTAHAGASFIASLVFAYSPYHFAHAEHHLQLSSIQFIPFFVLYLLRLFEHPRLKHALIAGGFLFLAALCSWYYLMYLAIFSTIFIIYQSTGRPHRYLNRRFLGWFLVMFLFFGMLVSPFVYPLLKDKLSGTHYFSKNLQLWFSADAAAFFIPPPAHPLAPNSFNELYTKLGGNTWEATVFLGYSVLLLTGYSVYKLSWKKTGPWVISGIAFALFSLGPRLHVMGKIIFPDMPMPYWLIHQIPLLRMISTPSRFVVMVTLSLAVLVGYGVKRILSDFTTKKIWLNRLGLGLIGGIVLWEYLALPVNICSPDQVTRARFLEQQLTADEGDYAILELPLLDYWCNNVFMYRQTLHHKKMLSGSISRLSHQAMGSLLGTPLKELLRTSNLEDDFFIKLKPLLRQNRVKYLIFNRYLYEESEGAKLYRSLSRAFKKNARLKNDIIIFEIYQETTSS
jgi:hypothetical protein